MESTDPFRPGEDRLSCPQCGTHNALGQSRCWNCQSSLSDAERIAFEPGRKARPASSPSAEDDS